MQSSKLFKDKNKREIVLNELVKMRMRTNPKTRANQNKVK